ncbi:MAG: TATA-box-binding protein [Candidatus Bathyarchaeota archaeon]|nr:TATA-box-binding protein [Candidatus Bathyarchaeota archaeon]
MTELEKEPEIKVENVVASASLEHGIDLQAVVKAFPIVEYRPDVFPGLVFRTKRPRTANLVFRTGKMVCTGAKSEKEARRALKKVVRKLKKTGMVIRGKLHIKIQNIVASVILGGKVDLEGFYERGGKVDLGGRMMYEPEQFPGVIYRMEDPKTVILIFSSGKLVCTGAKKEEEVNQAVMKLRQELDENDVIIYDTP